MKKIAYLLALLLVFLLLPAATAAETDTVVQPAALGVSETDAQVQQKIDEIIQECNASGVTGEYAVALWLHDWLIYNATYDYTFSIHGAEGVLLQGTGVCESYTRAYGLLLDRMNIENQQIRSAQIDHTWNLVKIEGQWCHVDCTWDDPGTGGQENHTYFGMNDALISRDHPLESPYTPICESLNNYYPLRNGQLCYADEDELAELLSQQAAAQNPSIPIVYVGADPEHSSFDAFSAWFSENNWQYGLAGYSISGTAYSCVISMRYSTPWEKPVNHLEEPAPAPSFALDSPEGKFILSNYADNGVVLIFGRKTCGNTASLLSRLTGQISGLNDLGIEVLVCVFDAYEPADLAGLQADYPGYHYTYGNSDLLWNYLSAAGYSANSVTFPCVFVINRDQMITYYSTGYVDDTTELISEASAIATNNPLPPPEKHSDISSMLNGTGNVNAITGGEEIVSALQALSQQKHVILLMNQYLGSGEESSMDYFEKHYQMYENLGVALVACFVEPGDEFKSAHPHCIFIDISNIFETDDFWALVQTVELYGSVYSNLSMFIEKGGKIAAYQNGGLLSLSDCTVYAARLVSYSAVMPDALTEIGSQAYQGVSFVSVNLNSDALVRICSGAFSDCPNLKIVRIPESVSVIEEDAFLNCGRITVICTVGSAAYRYAVEHGMDWVCE